MAKTNLIISTTRSIDLQVAAAASAAADTVREVMNQLAGPNGPGQHAPANFAL